MTNLEGRVLRRRRAAEPPAGVRAELWLLAELARRLGSPASFSADPEEVFDELARASAGGPADYSGIDYALLDTGAAVHWPCPSGGADPTGTPRLFLDRFAHPDGRARLVPVSPADPAETLNRGGSVTLVTGRLLEHYQSGAQTRRVPELSEAQPEPFLELHPVTAGRLGLADGTAAGVTSGRGRVRARVRVTTAVRPDTAFLPFHFPGAGSANLLTQSATDPVSGMPEFKTSAVTVTALTEEVASA